MKKTLFSIFSTLLFISIIFLPNTFAQGYTQSGLPEGATARLGKGSINEIAYSPDGTRLAVASAIGIWLYDAQSGQELNLLIGHTDSVNSVSFSPDGQTLASGGAWGIALWDVPTGSEKQRLTEHTGWVNSVSFSPDGQTLASGSSDETVRLWDVPTGSEKQILTEHTDSVNSVSFSPDGQTLASGSYDETVRLWDVVTGSEKQTLTGHRGPVNSVSFSPDGQTLASGSSDGTVRLWDVLMGSEKQILTGHTDYVESVSFSPDGQTLASGSYDGTVLLWDISSVTTSTGQEMPITEPTGLKGDVNGDGIVNIQDLVLVASNLGKTGQNAADVNGDGQVNIQDLVLVAGALGTSAAAPPIHLQSLEMLTAADVKSWLSQAQHFNLTDAMAQKGILFLEQLLAVLTPKDTVLLPNYPNPFNPETWIPYHLAKDVDVTLHIYAVNGTLVRTLALGHQAAGMYQSRSRAAHWDGKNEFGEKVASGLYFYTLTAGDFKATRKMLIRK